MNKLSTNFRFFFMIFLQLIIIVLMVVFFQKNKNLSQGNTSLENSLDYQVALKLESVGISREAAKILSHLLSGAPKDSKLHKLIYNLAELQMNEGQYEAALSNYYRLQIMGVDNDMKENVGRKIVSLLEKLGKTYASKLALKEQVTLQGKESEKALDVDETPVLAEVDSTKITLMKFSQYFDAMPSEMKKQFSTKEKKQELLQKIVAEELILKKAELLNLVEDKEYLKQMEMVRRQLQMQLVLERELMSKIKIEGLDVKNYYTAHKNQYVDEKKKELPFEQVKTKVEYDYRQEKVQEQYQLFMQDLVKKGSVKIYGDKIP